MNKKVEMYNRITDHGRQLIDVFSLPKDTDPVDLCKKLKRLETKATGLTTAYCNGTVEDIEDALDKILDKVDGILKFRSKGIPVFINRDPRGYALKIDDGYIRASNINIHRDWGGYGIIAPDLS